MCSSSRRRPRCPSRSSRCCSMSRISSSIACSARGRRVRRRRSCGQPIPHAGDVAPAWPPNPSPSPPRRRPGPPRAAVGLRQARHRRLRPGLAASGSSSSPPAAPRRRCATRAWRCARSTTSRASRRSWTGASRRCTRKLHGGLLAVRDDPEHVAAAAEHEHRARSTSCA